MAPATLPAAPAGAASVVASSTSASPSTTQRSPHARAVSFRIASKPKLPLFSSKALRRGFATRSCALVVKSQPSEVAGDSLNDAVVVGRTPESPAETSATEVAGAPDVSEFMAQIASLVKLVDSRDIVELQLKQQDFELVVRKKEALPQLAAPAPVVMMQPHGPPPVMQPQYAPPPAAASAGPAPAGGGVLAGVPPPPALPAKSAKSSLPPLKSPMAGTFYRSPGPGQPPFVKVGDKVNKGQVLCVIEAMKLMNEIEADQAGTVVEILVEDAKPVGIEQPLFVIEP